MYQLVYFHNDEMRFLNYDSAEDVRQDYKMFSRWGWKPVVYHTSKPQKPSIVPLPCCSGLRKEIWTGTREIYSSRITCDKFIVTFTRTASATIDDMCDALNGWYTKWSDEVTIKMYIDKNIYTCVRSLEDADKEFERLLDLTTLEMD